MLQRKIPALFLVLTLLAAGLPPFAAAGETVSVSAASAVLYEPTAGIVLYEKNAREVRPMASTTKLMTALVGAERLAAETPVTVAPEAVRVEGSSLGLKAGDTLPAKDLITGMLLASGNDAAGAVALAVSPTVEEFAQLMNQRATRLGMTDTGFVTPSGLDAPGHASTAYDMALLGAAVLKQPMLAEICRLKTAQIRITEPSRTIYVKNHNRLLSLYPDAIGLKTGFTRQSGRCLVSAAQRNGVTLIAVTLQASDDWNDHMALYEYGFGRVERVSFPEVTLPSLPVSGGMAGAAALTAAVPEPVVCLRDEPQALRAVVELPAFVLAPVSAGQKVGSIRYYVGTNEIVTVPITAVAAVEQAPRPAFLERLRRRLYTLLQHLCC